MIKVGLVGEDPHDTFSIKNLLLKRYHKKIQFFPLAKGVKGHQLDTIKLKKTVVVEMESYKCDFIIYIRDVDGFQSEKAKVKAKTDWFKSMDVITGNNNILLLNIWELEALIFADVDTFNKDYHINYRFSGNPMLIKDPKKELKKLTYKEKKRFHESHCPIIFNKLNIDLLEKNCIYFRAFLNELDLRIA